MTERDVAEKKEQSSEDETEAPTTTEFTTDYTTETELDEKSYGEHEDDEEDRTLKMTRKEVTKRIWAKMKQANLIFKTDICFSVVLDTLLSLYPWTLDPFLQNPKRLPHVVSHRKEVHEYINFINFKHLLFIDVSGNFLTTEALQVLTQIPYLLYLRAERNCWTSSCSIPSSASPKHEPHR
nr:unnamed protein product [Callosobruchus analis]